MKIKSIKAHPTLDSRGEWTIEVHLKTQNGVESVATVPQGKSTGSYEATYILPISAVKNIQKIIEPALIGVHVGNQKLIDHILNKLDGTKTKSRLGANAILGVSVAVLKAAAKAHNLPLWKYIARHLDIRTNPKNFPRLYVNVINGGLHTKNNLDFQEYLIIPKSRKIKESVQISLNFYQNLKNYLSQNYDPGSTGLGDEGGFAPNLKNNLEPFEILSQVALKNYSKNQFDFGLDAAASNIKISVPELFKIYLELRIKFNLFYLEDPFKEDDFKNFKKILERLGKSTLITGDDLTTTNLERMKKAYTNKSINAIIIKPNQIGSVTETLTAIDQAKKWGWKVIVSHRSGETEDDFIADLAFGAEADGLKLGAPARGERIAKYNRLLEIASEI